MENVPDEEEVEVDLAPSWNHSPAFELALRKSNSAWDHRPSSRDVIAKIRAVELQEEEAEQDEEQDAMVVMARNRRGLERGGSNRGSRRSAVPQQQQQNQGAEDSLAIIDEGRKINNPNVASLFEFHRVASRNKDAPSDDDVSALSDPTYVSNKNATFDVQRSIPHALFVPQKNTASAAALSPMTPQLQKKRLSTTDTMDKLALMAESGKLAMPDIVEPEAVVIEETEEQIKRRQKAEARAKKMEAISARRSTGQDDDASAVSGLSKRHRMRRKKKGQLAAIQQDEVSVKSDALSSQLSENKKVVTIKEETEEDKLRKKKAMARAAKLESMARLRNAGKDDDTAVSGISKRHRIRRKRSALAANAISPEEQKRLDWKQNVYASVLNSERVQWQTAIYAHVYNADTTREKNMEAKRNLDEQNAQAQLRLENRKKMEQRAKKFAARADRFHKIRRDGGGDDDDESKSLVSKASRMRRRRGRKSSSRSVAQSPLEEMAVSESAVAPLAATMEVVPHIVTAEEQDALERRQWCNQVYISAIRAQQIQWKKNVYALVLNAENEHIKVLALQARISKEDARKEKERVNKLRSKKIAQMKLIRDAKTKGEAPVDNDDQSSLATPTQGGSSAMKKMRERRRKAAMKKASK